MHIHKIISCDNNSWLCFYFFFLKYIQQEFIVTPFYSFGSIFQGLGTFLLNTKVKKTKAQRSCWTPQDHLVTETEKTWRPTKFTLSIFHISCWREQAKPPLSTVIMTSDSIFPEEWNQVQVSNPWKSWDVSSGWPGLLLTIERSLFIFSF